MRFVLLISLIAITIIPACANDKEILLTAEMYCTHLVEMQDVNEPRDKYDECILFKKEELQDKDECKISCDLYCGELDGSYVNSFADFSGCHCTCNIQ